jgi:polyphosphate kinase
MTVLKMEDEPPYADRIKRKAYERELRKLQIELLKVQQWVNNSGSQLVILFEGRDAAGKGGSIRRFTEHLNPRTARTVALAKPNETEQGQWYFQRYVQHLPTAGEMVLFDRSWYNRTGVERVMGFCTDDEYEQFFHQAPNLEADLVDSGMLLFKLWFTVSSDEQLRRFRQREQDPLRQWKLSPIDRAALDRYDEYGRARDAMLAATDTEAAPWTIVNSNEKKRARLESIRHVLSALDYTHKDPEVAHSPDPQVVRAASTLT